MFNSYTKSFKNYALILSLPEFDISFWKFSLILCIKISCIRERNGNCKVCLVEFIIEWWLPRDLKEPDVHPIEWCSCNYGPLSKGALARVVGHYNTQRPVFYITQELVCSTTQVRSRFTQREEETSHFLHSYVEGSEPKKRVQNQSHVLQWRRYLELCPHHRPWAQPPKPVYLIVPPF